MNSIDDPLPTLTRPGTVLFDLDGTLVDSGSSILAALRKALAEEGVPPLAPEVEPTLLGPPMYVALPPLIGAEATARVIPAYRRIFAGEGFVFRAGLYPGIEALLDGLARNRVRLAVATSKPEPTALALLENLGLASRFATICGDTLEAGRPSKGAVVAEALRRLGDSPQTQTQAQTRTRTVMVGDRKHDVIGAREQGLPCVGAGWGYGAPGELQAAGAVAVMPDPAALAAAWRVTWPGPQPTASPAAGR